MLKHTGATVAKSASKSSPPRPPKSPNAATRYAANQPTYATSLTIAHELALRDQAKSNPVSLKEDTPYGTRYIVDGPLAAPDGSALNVRSIWFITRGTVEPLFTTAHPLRKVRT